MCITKGGSILVLLSFVLWAIPSCEGLETLSLRRTEPGFKILRKWKEQKAWESTHDMNAMKDFAVNVHQYLISSMLKDKVQNASGCLKSLVHWGYDFVEKNKYAQQALDAAGKPGSGILLGNIRWTGRYFECLKAQGKYFDGRYCSLSIGPQYTDESLFGIPIGMAIGMCLPASCSEKFINMYLQIFSDNLNATVALQCQVQPSPWSTVDILSITVLSILFGLLMIGTAIDYYLTYKNRKENEALAVDPNQIPIIAERDEAETPPVWTEIARSFSAIKNTNAILDTNPKRDVISCLHGIRFISISWVVLCHTYVITLMYSDNLTDAADWFFDAFSFQVIANGTLGVDTFFFLSGLLVTYLALRESINFHGKHIPFMYIKRYFRLTPTYAFAILVMVGFYRHLAVGPMWPDAYNPSKEACEAYWWTNLLYISNLHPSGFLAECFPLGWYLSNDMQFFLLAPISILLLKWRPKVGFGILLAGLFSSALVTGVISTHYEQQATTVAMAIFLKNIMNGFFPQPTSPTPPNNTLLEESNLGMPPPGLPASDVFWSDLYSKPWCRIGVYLVGMMTGYVLHVTKMRFNVNKLIAAIGWAVAIAINLSVLYGLWWHSKEAQPTTVGLAAFYNSLSRPMWAVGLAWLVVACSSGYGGLVNTFLSWKLFIPLSRLTFCIYLVHPPIIVWWHASQEVTTHFSNIQMTFYFLGTLVGCIGVAYVLSILVEMPFVNLINLLLRRCRKKSPRRRNDEQILINEETPES